MNLSDFIEIQNLGLNLGSGIFLTTILFTVLQAVALMKQILKIVTKKSGESVSFSFFSYYSFSAMAIGIFGFQAKTLSLAIMVGCWEY